MRNSLFIIAFSIAALSLGACKNPADNVPTAQISEPEAAAPADNAQGEQAAAAGDEAAAGDDQAADAPAARTAALTPENTKLSFQASKVTLTHDGGWNNVTGTITAPDANAANGSVELQIEMASIYTDANQLTGHLLSDDFFNAESFPHATFKSVSIVAAEGENAYTITGTLTIKDTAKNVTFPATIAVADSGVNASAEFSIDRQVWGISYPGMPDDLIRDEVIIRFNIEAAF